MIIEDFVPLFFIVAVLVGFHFLRLKLMGATVTSEELAERMKVDDVKVIDVRSAPEYHGDMGHIPGAVNIPVGELADEIEMIKNGKGVQKDAPIVTICRTHNRSPRAARMLRDAGFTDVYVLKNGMVGWSRKSLPVEK